MAEIAEASTTTPSELLATGRRHLAVRDFNVATSTLSKACEMLATEHGDTADQCAEAYLWYGKALLGLSREESGVFGEGMPGTGNADEEEDIEAQEENGEDQNGESKAEADKEDDGVEKSEAQSTTKDESPVNSPEEEATDKEATDKEATDEEATDEPGTANDEDDSAVNMEEDDVDNLQLAWETLDLARSILYRRVQDVGGDPARALLADVHLALGEVALENGTYDKAVTEMQTCLDLQKELKSCDDRIIAETHYQIGLAQSFAANLEEAITHFKNAANILETRIKTLENPSAVTEDATVKKYVTADSLYSVEDEIKEIKALLPEIQQKIQDMVLYKSEAIKRVYETLYPPNGSQEEASVSNGAGASSSSSQSKPTASDISHLIKRKRKASDSEAESSASKRLNK